MKIELMDKSVEMQMRLMISGWERGKIFFAQDFTSLGNPENVRKGLCSLTNEKFIIRLARGIYCYPKIVGGYKLQTIYPSDDAIAYAISDRDKVRIIPYGDKAAYELGLTGMTVSGSRYLTDGAPRQINVSNSRKIYFNHTSEVKIFSYINTLMQDICSAIRVLGVENIDDNKLKIIRDKIKSVPMNEFEHDIKLPPVWVSDILIPLYNL